MNTLLEVKDLRTRFHTAEGTIFAVNGVSFKLDEGETLAVVGESGCGKSVTMMSILGLIPIPPGEIASGAALYRGDDLLKFGERRLSQIRGKEIAMVFQDPMTSLNPVFSIRRQMTEGMIHHLGLSKADAEKRALEFLDAVGIPDAKRRLGNYPHQFSGGMRQRVMIAMALSCLPSILIADEPTTALDVTIQAQILELVIHLREQFAMAMIWITHDLGIVAGLADRVLVMYAGLIVEKASVDDLYTRAAHPYTLALLAALPRADRRREHRLKSIPGAPPNLVSEPRYCPFAPRCEHAQDVCWKHVPPLTPLSGQENSGHQVACWVDVSTGKLR